MSLREYHRKRDFARTKEPKGGTPKPRPTGEFVVQKHWATRLHYDFRLELNGVLKSWAVPKGPSLDTSQRRLAVQVEDHPFEYRKFEGLIPEGEYGGGTVMVWDTGHWMPLGDDPERDLREGRLKFVLDGQKLKGGFMLVRMPNRDGRDGKPNWLLIKERDEYARPLSKGDVLEEEPNSAATGRTVEQIKATKKVAIWNSRPKGSAPRAKPAAEPKTTKATASTSKLAGAKRAALPKQWDPQLATLIATAPDGDEWLHELKFDGYRMACHFDHGRVKFLSRQNNDWTAKVLVLARQAEKLPAQTALLDGEVVVLDEEGISSFQLLQNSLGHGSQAGTMLYCAFDLLHLDGQSLVAMTQEDRKAALEALLGKLPKSARQIHLSEHVIGSGGTFHREACRKGLEGIISKRRDAPYTPGRSYDWLKIKCRQTQEMVLGGFSEPQGSRTGFGALLLGYYDKNGKLIYAGRVGTGFTDRTLRELSKKFQTLKQSKSPFASVPRGEGGSDVTWIKPQLVAQIEFSNWTHDGLLRQAAFLGLREDKAPREVRRELPAATEQVAKKKSSRVTKKKTPKKKK